VKLGLSGSGATFEDSGILHQNHLQILLLPFSIVLVLTWADVILVMYLNLDQQARLSEV
jgi:hypothetical protein